MADPALRHRNALQCVLKVPSTSSRVSDGYLPARPLQIMYNFFASSPTENSCWVPLQKSHMLNMMISVHKNIVFVLAITIYAEMILTSQQVGSQMRYNQPLSAHAKQTEAKLGRHLFVFERLCIAFLLFFSPHIPYY